MKIYIMYLITVEHDSSLTICTWKYVHKLNYENWDGGLKSHLRNVIASHDMVCMHILYDTIS